MDKRSMVARILGRLPKGWAAKELRELCVYIQRGTAPAYVEDSHIRALNQRAIRWGRIEEDYLKYHDPDVPIPQRHMILAGDVVVNSTGDITIGRAYLFKTTPKPMFADSHVTIVRTDSEKLRAEYLVNLLATSEYQDLIYSMVTGSTGQLEFNKSNLEQLPILWPPESVQNELCQLMEPLYQSMEQCDRMRSHCEDALARLLDVHVLDHWKETRWRKS